MAKLRIGHPRNGGDSLTRLWVLFQAPSQRESFVYFSRDWNSPSSRFKNKEKGIGRLEKNIIEAKKGSYRLAILYDNFTDIPLGVYDQFGVRHEWDEFKSKSYKQLPVGKDISLTRLWVRFKQQTETGRSKTYTYYSNDTDMETGVPCLRTGIQRFEKHILLGSQRGKFVEARLYDNKNGKLLASYDKFLRKTIICKQLKQA